MEHAFVPHPSLFTRAPVAIHVLMEHAFVLFPVMEVILRCRNPRAHGTRVCTFFSLEGEPLMVAIHVLMEHAFVLNRRVETMKYASQSTCSWNTRLYALHRRKKLHYVAIHVLMEHAFVPSEPVRGRSHSVAIHVLMEHAFVLPETNTKRIIKSQSTCSWNTRLYAANRAIFSEGVAIHVLMEHAFVPVQELYDFVQCRNPRAHGTRVCTS